MMEWFAAHSIYIVYLRAENNSIWRQFRAYTPHLRQDNAVLCDITHPRKHLHHCTFTVPAMCVCRVVHYKMGFRTNMGFVA